MTAIYTFIGYLLNILMAGHVNRMRYGVQLQCTAVSVVSHTFITMLKTTATE